MIKIYYFNNILRRIFLCVCDQTLFI